MSDHALGIDVGLSGVRATVMRADGRLVSRARRPHARALVTDGLAEHDPADWLDGITAAGREAIAAAGDAAIESLGVAALGPAPLLVDERLEPLTPALLFGLDGRAEEQRRRLSEGTDGATLDNALPKLAWWRECEPAIADRTVWALDATGFVVATLTGTPVMDSVTAGDYALPGVEPALPIPEPVDPLAVAGRLKPDWAGRLGLRAGLPVTAGTYDSFADIAGAGVRRPGDAGVVLGSTMIICRAAATEVEPPDGLGASAYPGEGRLLGGWTLSGGRVLDWFSERFGAGVDLAAASAEVEPGRLLAVPYLSGERTPLWDPFARGALIGLSTDTAAPHVYRALVESLALSVLDHAARLEDALGACAAWRVTGGGTRNDVWIEATADALGAPLEIAADAAEAAGPALLALRMTGTDPPRPCVATVEPNSERGERLRSRLPAFRALGRAARDLLAEPDNSEVAP